MFLGVKVLLMTAPAMIGLILGCARILPAQYRRAGGGMPGNRRHDRAQPLARSRQVPSRPGFCDAHSPMRSTSWSSVSREG